MLVSKIPMFAVLTGALLGVGCGASEGSSSAAAVSADTLAARSAQVPAVGDTTLERLADHARIQGSANAPVWVVEVSDFQCPYCEEWHRETYPVIKREYVDAGKVRLAYINFPLSIHRNAWPAAEAAMCAGTQNRFWPMHDALFAAQAVWERLADPTPVLDSLARSVGVDLDAYHACITEHKVRPLIQADIDRATEAGVNGTPSFLIGKTMISGAQPAEVFRRAIDAALKQGDAASNGQGAGGGGRG